MLYKKLINTEKYGLLKKCVRKINSAQPERFEMKISVE